MTKSPDRHPSEIKESDLYLFNTGCNFQAYRTLGAHKIKAGWRFSVWAPHAKSVCLCGDFNHWNPTSHPLEKIGTTGVWCGVFSEIGEYELYKYAVTSQDGTTVLKADPFAFSSEIRPGTASVVRNLSGFRWSDGRYLKQRRASDPFSMPILIYEIHLGSWRMHEDGSFLSYRELAEELIPYLLEMHYTHVEFLPLTEYPYDASWGYQVSGYFSATSRYGTPEDLKYLINACHRAGIGVIMDWVPAHFPRDLHGLFRFDGIPTYEYADSRLGEHKEWGTMVFDYSKKEVISFLLSSAYFWICEFHIDGLRVDAVSSMLYLDYDRPNGAWIPNRYGGNHNPDAVAFLQTLNRVIAEYDPSILMIAEESTAWANVTGDIKSGGLGFHFKWNMGWMNDTLRYMSLDPIFRKANHSLLTFLLCYAFSEQFILPLSHDEAVHGKRSLIEKMYGSYEEKFASLRVMMGYYMSLPGKKLLFMGGEFAQFIEWRFDAPLDWFLLRYPMHQKFRHYMRDLNEFYRMHSEFWKNDRDWNGFCWSDPDDCENSVLSYLRTDADASVLVVLNFTPVQRKNYRIGVPEEGSYEVLLNSAWKKYGGTQAKRTKICPSQKRPHGKMPFSIELTLAGFSAIYLKKQKGDETNER